jgi:hypothetical protein
MSWTMILYTPRFRHLCSIEYVDREKAGVGGDSREASTYTSQRTSDQVRALSLNAQLHVVRM